MIGTFAYMSPEHLGGDPAGPASDVFSLGSVLAFAATGRPPFTGDTAATVMFRLVSGPPDLAGVADQELTGLTTEQAIALLHAAGFVVKVAKFGTVDKVFGYAPAGSAPRGSTITIDTGF